jgi:hypothetical protein
VSKRIRIMAKPTEPLTPGYMQPLCCDRGGNITPNEPFTVTGSTKPEFATFIHVGTGYPDNTGDVVVQYHNGIIAVWHGKRSDTICPGKAIAKVLSTAVVNGVTENTTATNLTWHGGQ